MLPSKSVGEYRGRRIAQTRFSVEYFNSPFVPVQFTEIPGLSTTSSHLSTNLELFSQNQSLHAHSRFKKKEGVFFGQFYEPPIWAFRGFPQKKMGKKRRKGRRDMCLLKRWGRDVCLKHRTNKGFSQKINIKRKHNRL